MEKEEQHQDLLRELICNTRYDGARAEAFKAKHGGWDMEKGTIVLLFSDEQYLQVDSLNDEAVVRTVVQRMRAEQTHLIAMIDVGARLLKSTTADSVGTTDERREGYFYSPITEQYYPLGTCKGRKDTQVSDLLIGAVGIIAGRAEPSPRFCETRMMSHQNGRCSVTQ